MNIIIFGAPASGKGSLSELICKHYGLAHIATGDIYRKAVAENTELGKLVGPIMKEGRLVPDDITNDIFKKRLKQKDCKNGMILDGYPRTLVQANVCDKLINIDLVVELIVPRHELIARMTTRMVCKECNTIHNRRNEKCDACRECGGQLYQREDDNEVAAEKRIATYESQTAPLKEHYKAKIFKIVVKNLATPQDTFDTIKDYIARNIEKAK